MTTWTAHPIVAQYLDPGAGSYIFQLLIAGFLAFFFFFSTKIKMFLSRFFHRSSKEDGAE